MGETTTEHDISGRRGRLRTDLPFPACALAGLVRYEIYATAPTAPSGVPMMRNPPRPHPPRPASPAARRPCRLRAAALVLVFAAPLSACAGMQAKPVCIGPGVQGTQLAPMYRCEAGTPGHAIVNQ